MGAKPRGYPTEVWIRHCRWPVHYVEPSHPALQEEDDAHNLGCCDIHKREIYIDRTQDRASLRDTLIHEIAHAYYLGSGMPDDAEIEERTVCLMTAFVLELEAAGLAKVKP